MSHIKIDGALTQSPMPEGAAWSDLQECAEVIEVRQAWERMMLTAPFEQTDGPAADAWMADPTRDGMAFIRRIHAAGWRPGMTAEDAARLLAEASR